MMESIGFLELNSIARGVEAADTIAKAADVTLLYAKTCCPGKFNILFHGDVAAVSASLDSGRRTGGRFVVDGVVIARVHPAVVRAISQTLEPVESGALGVMEFYSVTAAISGADAAVKAADVDLLDVRLGMGIGGKSYVVLSGDVAAVHAAVEAGIGPATEEGYYLSSAVIPNPRPEVFESLV